VLTNRKSALSREALGAHLRTTSSNAKWDMQGVQLGGE